MTEPTVVTADELASKDGQFDHDLEYALKSEQHLWIALTTHRLSDADVTGLVGPESYSPVLGRESLVNVSVGCYLCERELDPRLVGKRCKGESKR